MKKLKMAKLDRVAAWIRREAFSNMDLMAEKKGLSATWRATRHPEYWRAKAKEVLKLYGVF